MENIHKTIYHPGSKFPKNSQYYVTKSIECIINPTKSIGSSIGLRADVLVEKRGELDAFGSPIFKSFRIRKEEKKKKKKSINVLDIK